MQRLFQGKLPLVSCVDSIDLAVFGNTSAYIWGETYMRNTLKFLAFSIAIAGLALVAGPASAASLTIDDFTDANPGPNQSASQTGAGFTSDSDVGLTGVIAPGTRELYIDLSADPGSFGGSTTVSTGLEVLAVSLGTSVDGFGESRYLGLSSEDLLLGELPANAYFQAQVVFADQDVDLTATITDGSANVATYTFNGLVTGNFINQALGSFVNAGSVDFTDVASIVIRLSGPTGFDASISLLEITTTPGGSSSTPEPSSVALAMCGLFGLALARRRKRA
jgi:hypothetical protein